MSDLEIDVKELKNSIRMLILEFENRNKVDLTEIKYIELPQITANSNPEKWVMISYSPKT